MEKAMNVKTRLAVTAIASATLFATFGAAAAQASPVGGLPTVQCTDQTGSGNSPTVTFPGGGDLGFHMSTCIQYSLSSDMYDTYIEADWHDADNNRPAVPFDELTVHVELQTFDSPLHWKDCDFTSAMNSASGTAGTFICDIGYFAGPASGYYLSSDGYIKWDINNDGLGELPTNQLSGSPNFYDDHGLMRHQIATLANSEYANTAHNYEYDTSSGNHGSTNCTYYTGVMYSTLYSGAPTCGNSTNGVAWRGSTSEGTSSYAWCAVFADYVYTHIAGSNGDTVNTSGISAAADSMRTKSSANWHAESWSTATSTSGWHPLPGDAVVYSDGSDGTGIGSHTGVVVSDIYSITSNTWTITTVEGNYSDTIWKGTPQSASSGTHADLLGFGALTYNNA
jgi:hypothetical protein